MLRRFPSSPGPLCAVLLCVSALRGQVAVQEYPIPRANAFPHDPAVSADGTAWYTDQANSYIGRFDPVTLQFTDVATPTLGSGPHGITVVPSGHVWYTAQSTGRLGRLDPATMTIQEVVLPANANRPHTPLWHQGGLWFTAQSNQTYGRLDGTTSAVQVYPAPAGSNPYGLAAGPDGYLWIALFGTNKLGRVDPANGALLLFDLPSSAARPRRLAVGQDGYVWYTDYARGYLGRLLPSTRQVVEWASPVSGPYGISLGVDGRVWYHGANAAVMVAFDPRTLTFATVSVPTAGATVRHMVTDYPRGRLWLALSGTQRLGKVELGAPAELYASACAGASGLPVFTLEGTPRIGTQMTLGVANTQATQAFLWLGASGSAWGSLALPFDLGPFGAPGCLLSASAEVVLYAGAPAPTLPLPVPLDSTLGGVVVVLQWGLLGDPGRPVVTTRVLRLRLIGI